MKDPKKINFAERMFTANGKNYFISTSVSVGRAVYIEEAKIEMETGVRVGQTTEGFIRIYDLLNAGKVADAAREAYNRAMAVDTMLNRPSPALRICACFMNREGEDIRGITEELVMSKIEDWKAEGLSMESFFTIALIFIAEETADLKSFTKKLEQEIAENFKRKLAQGELSTPISV